MDPEPELVDLLGRPDARAIAFDPLGGSSVPLPPAFEPCAARLLDGDSPLDHIDPESQGRAVVAFEHARRHGRGAAPIKLAGEAEEAWLEIFDLQRAHGCFLAVVTVGRPTAPDVPAATDPAPRQSRYSLNVSGVIQTISPEFTRMFGWTEDAVIGRSSLDFIHPDDHENGIVGWVELLERPGGQVRLRQRLRTASGDWRWCELTDTNLLDDPGHRCVRSEIVDVSREMTAQAALQHRETLLDRLSQALPTGVLQLDADGLVAVRNERWTELTGGSETDGLDAFLGCIADRAAVEDLVDRALRCGEDADVAVILDGRGSCRYGELHLRPLDNAGGSLGLLITLDDVTKLQAYQMELTEQARRDALTGVRNRRGIEEILQSRLAANRVGDGSVTILFLDLDRFKAINDAHGHIIGDEVLRLVAKCVKGLLRSGDHIGRLGGDEFLVVLGLGTDRRAAEAIAGRIAAAVPGVEERFAQDLFIGVSIGVAESRPDDDFDSLIKRADVAMYRAKSAEAADGAETQPT